MTTSTESLAAIRQLRADKKFAAVSLYPGAPNEDIRLRCESKVNQFLDGILALLAHDASKEEILSRAKDMLDSFSKEDTEEQERVDDYVGEIMRIIGLDDWTDFI